MSLQTHPSRVLMISALCIGAVSGRAALAEEDIAVIAKKLGDIFQSVTGKRPPVKRTVFAKSHGCVQAQFEVNPELPSELKIGVFSAQSYPAWLRFSNDGPARPDQEKAARGMAVKLVGVPGKKILDEELDAMTQDFVMQNHPVFFNNTAKDFLDFNEAAFSQDPKVQEAYDRAHPETNRILAEMDQNVLTDPLDGQYWTPTPYQLGKNVIKFMAKPCAVAPDPSTKPMTAANYLRENMATHLKESSACFTFWIQLQKNPKTMPVDQAAVLWSEKESPFIHAATLKVSQGQNINAPTRDRLCENLSFTPWHSLPEHRPLGSLNEARRFVYKRIADYRRKLNQVPIAEPAKIDPLE